MRVALASALFIEPDLLLLDGELKETHTCANRALKRGSVES